jgi:redox-sensitive bicupin YhaK (pirin superfamily)
LAANQEVTHAAAGAGRRTYLFVINGNVTVNGARLNTRDQGRIADEPALDIAAGASGAEFMLIDLP